MRRTWSLARRAGSLAFALLFCASALHAQEPELPGRLEVSGGWTWGTGTSAGSRNATLTTATDADFTLFESDSEIPAAQAWQASIGIRLSRTFQAEVAASYATPELRTAVTSDFEGIPDVTVVERLTQYTFQGGLIQHLPDLQFGRIVPFAAAGAGIQRVLHEDDALVETGPTFYFGGGLTVPLLTTSGGLKMVAVRAEGRAVGRREGAAFDNRVRFAAALGASLVIRF